MLSFSRRNFIKKTGIASVGFIGLQTFLSISLNSCEREHYNQKDARLIRKFGRLKKDPAGILNLPKGFSYKIIARQGDKMDDGLLSPDKPDGMATFLTKDQKVILIRNHELVPSNKGPFGNNNELLHKVPKSKFYDYGFGKDVCTGGTSTLIYNETTQEVEKSFLSLIGTLRNCAGGLTPWNSWISCEEIVINASNMLEKNHGYNFEVPATEHVHIVDPIPLKDMGRFNHEAVCVNPLSGIIYQTEDRGDGLIYRFLPNTNQVLQNGGRLQVLSVKKRKSCDTRNWIETNEETFPLLQKMEVEWLDINGVDSENDDLRARGFEMGAARFARGEGMWFGNKEVYFACTNGGKTKTGQIFRYTPSPFEGQTNEKDHPGTLELFLEPNNTAILQNCDNLTIAPWGDVILVEDVSDPFIIGITPEGKSYKIAENIGYRSEMAGITFSPSGKTLFVNIQHAGLTLAISGDF